MCTSTGTHGTERAHGQALPADSGNWRHLKRLRMLVPSDQGLTLVHFSAQLEPCLTQENTLHTLNTPLTRATRPLRAPPMPCRALKLS